VFKVVCDYWRMHIRGPFVKWNIAMLKGGSRKLIGGSSSALDQHQLKAGVIGEGRRARVFERMRRESDSRGFST